MAYLPEKIDAHKDQAIRRVLSPLAKVAEETGAAIVVVRHLNKGTSENVLYRGGGSIGIIGAVRSGLIVGPDPSDSTGGQRILAVQKTNLAAKKQSLIYRVEANGEDIPTVMWLGKSSHTASTLFAPSENTEQGALGEAKAFLRDLLSGGPVTASEAKQASSDAGISERTVERAKKELGVTSNKQEFNGKFIWTLPGHEDRQIERRPPTNDEDRQLHGDGGERQDIEKKVTSMNADRFVPDKKSA